MYDNTILKYHIKLKNMLFNKAMINLENSIQSINILEFNIPLDFINSIGLPNYIEENCENNVAYTLKQYVNDIYYFNKNTKVIKEIDFNECLSSNPNIIICLFTLSSPEFHLSDLDCLLKYIRTNKAILLGSFYDETDIDAMKTKNNECFKIKDGKLLFSYNTIRGMKISNEISLFNKEFIMGKSKEHGINVEFFKYKDIDTRHEKFLTDDFKNSLELRTCFICKGF